MKPATRAALLTATLLMFGIWLLAEPVSQLRPADYVNDYAGVLDGSTVTQLDTICQQVEHKANAQIAIVTIKSLDGADIVSYSVDLYTKWGIGKKGSDRGILILLAVQDRRYWVTTGYGLEPILPDGKIGGFGREAVPLLKQGDYGGALVLLTSRIADVIAADAGVQLDYARPAAPARTQRSENGSVSLGTIIFWLVILALVVFTPLGRLLLWGMILGGGRSSGGGWGGGGWGGGGFGGGGGGFGGFGGGSTGGGGAGGSW